MNEDMILTTALVNQLQCAQASDVSLEERECNAMFNGNVVDSDSCEDHSDGVADCSQVDLATDSEVSTVDTVDNVACDNDSSLTAVQTDVTADAFRAEQLSS